MVSKLCTSSQSQSYAMDVRFTGVYPLSLSITRSLIRTHRNGDRNATCGLKIHLNTTAPLKRPPMPPRLPDRRLLAPPLRIPNSIPLKRQIEKLQANHEEEKGRKKAKKQAKKAANPSSLTRREQKLQAERERTITSLNAPAHAAEQCFERHRSNYLSIKDNQTDLALRGHYRQDTDFIKHQVDPLSG